MMDTMKLNRGPITTPDVAIAAVASLVGLVLMVENVTDKAIQANALAIPLFLIVTVPLLWRRAAPLAALVMVLAGLLVHLALFGTDVVRCGVVLPAAFLLVFAAGKRLEQREALLGLGLGLALIAVEGSYFLGAFALFFGAVAVAIWATGRLVRSRSSMADELEVRTGELRRARDERAELEVATERARLSVQLDELLQRRLGELAKLADEGAEPADPEATRATLVAIERESRRTLEQMRGLVGVLRDDATAASTSPQPAVTQLEALVLRAKGADARFAIEGSPRALPAGVELSAYRIVEHLLAVVDDDRDDVEVCVRFSDSAIEIDVSGPARRRADSAIERARERVKLHHGTLEATRRRGQASARVSLPLPVLSQV